MPTVEGSVEIARPAADVFDYLTDVERFREWQQTVVEAHAQGALAVGTRIRDVREFLGRRAASTLEVTALERPTRFALRAVEGPLRYSIDHLLDERDGRTRVTVRAGARVPGLLGLAARPMVKAAERQLRADLDRLRLALEPES